MKELKQLEYDTQIQGDVREFRMAKIPPRSKPQNVRFRQGDACDLSESLGT